MTDSTTNKRISVVTPVYNERENLDAFVREVCAALADYDYELILVNDGSTDGSGAALDALATAHPGVVTAIHLSRNFGMEPAISAGLAASTGAAVIILDADLQDDPAAFKAFIAAWEDGADVAYAVRSSREEFWMRRLLFWGFYRLLSWIANVELPLDASNFALMDRKVVDTLLALPERNRFLRGLRAWAGFQQVGVPVARRKRQHGATRLGLRGQWKLAMNAIFAFSYAPLMLFRFAGALTLVLSAGLIVWALYYKLIAGLEIRAWASQLISISFFGGINILGIGVIGEYVARIHDEVKGRPNYVVQRVTKMQASGGDVAAGPVRDD